MPESARHRVVVIIEMVSDDGPPDKLFWTDYLSEVLADDEVVAVHVLTEEEARKALRP